MFCIKCGSSIPKDSSFCTNCGSKISTDAPKEKLFLWTRRKSIFLMLISIVITSVIWLFLLGSRMLTTEDESVNIITNSLETIGRQFKVSDKSEQMITLFSYGISEECLYAYGCVDEIIDAITTLRAEIDKENEEIDRIWSQELLGQDFLNFFSNLELKSQTKISDIINLYFPEESEEFTPSVNPVNLL